MALAAIRNRRQATALVTIPASGISGNALSEAISGMRYHGSLKAVPQSAMVSPCLKPHRKSL
jgi:hypothetical protein